MGFCWKCLPILKQDAMDLYKGWPNEKGRFNIKQIYYDKNNHRDHVSVQARNAFFISRSDIKNIYVYITAGTWDGGWKTSP